jgi:hypothetical protein
MVLFKEISLKIISAYKSKNFGMLRRMAARLLGSPAIENAKGNKLFFTLIKYFHPDRFISIMKDIDLSFANNDIAKLQFYKNLFTSGIDSKDSGKRDFAFETEEEYGYDIVDMEEDMFDFFGNEANDALSETDEDFDFYSAVKSALYGNLDFQVEQEDLEFLAGELNLADYNLEDLDGLEYCVRITSLDLSNNRISNLYEIESLEDLRELYLADNFINDIDYLKGLANLEILDLSGNDIEDVSALLGLEHLQFVDLRNNPISNFDAVDALKARSVVVID